MRGDGSNPRCHLEVLRSCCHWLDRHHLSWRHRHAGGRWTRCRREAHIMPGRVLRMFMSHNVTRLGTSLRNDYDFCPSPESCPTTYWKKPIVKMVHVAARARARSACHEQWFDKPDVGGSERSGVVWWSAAGQGFPDAVTAVSSTLLAERPAIFQEQEPPSWRRFVHMPRRM